MSPLPSSLAKWLQRVLRISTTAFVGRWYLPLPRRVPFNLCIGNPVPTTAQAGETLDQTVARVHAAYKAELHSLYHGNQVRFGYEGRSLVFTCELEAARKASKAKAA